MTDEKKNSTQQVGVGDNIRVIKQPEGYFVSLRDGRTGPWGRWALTEDASLIAAYESLMREEAADETTIPPWLERSEFQHSLDDDECVYDAAAALDEVIDGGHNASMLLPEWLAWRSRVAEALGLVDLASALADFQTMMDAMRAGTDKAIAAELRSVAERLEATHLRCRKFVAMDIRARADDLDQP